MANMSRRNILSLFAGTGAAAATGANPAKLVQELGVSGWLDADVPQTTGGVVSAGRSRQSIGRYLDRYHMADALFTKKRMLRETPNRVPEHIASKKSWSGAYKMHVAAREQYQMWDIEQKIRHDEDFALKVAKHLGIV